MEVITVSDGAVGWPLTVFGGQRRKLHEVLKHKAVGVGRRPPTFAQINTHNVPNRFVVGLLFLHPADTAFRHLHGILRCLSDGG